MGILQTPEETKHFRISTCPDPELVFTQDDGSYSKNFFFVGQVLLKAQALKLLDVLEKKCPHTYEDNAHRKDCPYCVAEIRKDINNDRQ